jgi:hypothetical protein
MSEIALSRDEWESYVKAKMLQAKLDGSPVSIFVDENFGGDFGHSIEKVYEVAASNGWMEYVGEAEYLNGNGEVWLTDMGVVFVKISQRGGHVNCHPKKHIEQLREMGKLAEVSTGMSS